MKPRPGDRNRHANREVKGCDTTGPKVIPAPSGRDAAALLEFATPARTSLRVTMDASSRSRHGRSPSTRRKPTAASISNRITDFFLSSEIRARNAGGAHPNHNRISMRPSGSGGRSTWRETTPHRAERIRLVPENRDASDPRGTRARSGRSKTTRSHVADRLRQTHPGSFVSYVNAVGRKASAVPPRAATIARLEASARRRLGARYACWRKRSEAERGTRAVGVHRIPCRLPIGAGSRCRARRA